jgi:hypothetical protein
MKLSKKLTAKIQKCAELENKSMGKYIKDKLEFATDITLLKAIQEKQAYEV